MSSMGWSSGQLEDGKMNDSEDKIKLSVHTRSSSRLSPLFLLGGFHISGIAVSH